MRWKMKTVLPIFAGLLLLPESCFALDYDDDPSLDFIWTPAEGEFEGYHVYVSRNGGEYQLEGTTTEERFSVIGHNGEIVRVKVAAFLGAEEGEMSEESEPVICILNVPPPPPKPIHIGAY